MPQLMPIDKRRIEGLLQPTVLIVDHEALYRWFVAESLHPRGVHVVQCQTMGEAARYLDRYPDADLLLVDGQSVADEGRVGLEELRGCRRMPVCVVLDLDGPDAISLGVDGIVAAGKPADPGALAALVERHLTHS